MKNTLRPPFLLLALLLLLSPIILGQQQSKESTNQGSVFQPPRIIKSPDPHYTKEAKEKKVQGTVVLLVTINTNGDPKEITVKRPLGYGLDETAIEAVKKWKFKPAIRDGVPVGVTINIEIVFRLPNVQPIEPLH